ncbi:MAG: type I restriction endonuclease subunit R [Candidatus Methanomethylophilaceae archaeon]|nr:type I restriction endonuclease subunit R [Candidatus Methanomethylophilaceae archaeon]
MSFTEESLENAIMKGLEARGYEHTLGTTIERDNRNILLYDDLKDYLIHKYPSITEPEIRRVIIAFQVSDRGDYVNNRETLSRIREGFNIKRDDKKSNLWINLLDFDHPDNNSFRVVNQYEIQGPQMLRRPDAIVFINGIPLVVLEFKSAVREEATIEDAYHQLNTRYIRDIPTLFTFNAFTVISDGVNSKIGTVFTDYSNYYSWNKVNSDDPPSEGISSLYTLLDGVFSKDRLLAIICDFIYFPDDSGKNLKLVCRYPQYFGATRLLENIRNHMKPEGDGKGGTYFGTTGCGKSYTMLFLTRLLMRSKDMRNPTVILITDRENLDNQLQSNFTKSKKFLGDENVVSADTGADLRSKLKDVASGGVYLSTIQKFNEEGTLLSDRNNIIIISDEAHRSQLNLEDSDRIVDGKRKHMVGFAKILHDAFPNATYVGFSGTPIDATMDVFGEIVDQYTMAESEKDNITSKIIYEGRAAKVRLSEEQMKAIEEFYLEAENRGANYYQVEKSKREMSKMEVIVGNEERLQHVADDFIAHYEKRVEENATVCGKALFVCTSRKIAFRFYQILQEKRPEWFVIRNPDPSDNPSDDKAKPIEMVRLVATRGSDDPAELFDLCGDSEYRKDLEIQFKKKESNFKIAIVVDMWLTGFDVPFLDTMYIDKPIQKHSLIQAISRVNRIYPGKECGLVVDYLGIRKELDKALFDYAGGKRAKEGFDMTEEFVGIVRETLSALDGRFFNFDSSDYYGDDEELQMKCLDRAMEFVQQSKDFERWFMESVRKLKTAYNNCVYSEDITKQERDRIYFYSGVRSMLAKLTHDGSYDTAMMNRVVTELLERAIISDEVVQLSMMVDNEEVDRIELLSEENLAKIRSIPGSNSKFKLLERLTRLAIASTARVNKLQADNFSEKFKKIVEKYNDRHVGLLEIQQILDSMTDDVVELLNSELFKLLEDIKNQSSAGNELGLSPQEMAFYDILNRTIEIFQFKFDKDKLPAMAKDLKKCADEICSVIDWSSKQDVKDELRMEIAFVMSNYGFPPEYLNGVYEEVFKQMENYKKYSI